MRKTRQAYEEYLNDLYYGQDLKDFNGGMYSYMPPQLLSKGKLGTALRKHDSISFNVGFSEWQMED